VHQLSFHEGATRSNGQSISPFRMELTELTSSLVDLRNLFRLVDELHKTRRYDYVTRIIIIIIIEMRTWCNPYNGRVAWCEQAQQPNPITPISKLPRGFSRECERNGANGPIGGSSSWLVATIVWTGCTSGLLTMKLLGFDGGLEPNSLKTKLCSQGTSIGIPEYQTHHFNKSTSTYIHILYIVFMWFTTKPNCISRYTTRFGDVSKWGCPWVPQVPFFQLKIGSLGHPYFETSPFGPIQIRFRYGCGCFMVMIWLILILTHRFMFGFDVVML
jgi:hypothetical protein